MTDRNPGRPLTQEDLTTALAYFWHPVCTLDELTTAPGAVLAVRLLDRELVVADLGSGRLACLIDRCLHRSTRLSVGCVDQETIRCAYHGWRWSFDGRCVEVPSAPDSPISSRARLEAFEVETHYGLVWVRLDASAGTTVPPCPAMEDPAMKVVAGTPYTWPVAAGRRVENFTDLSHFAWVHDGSLGRRDCPTSPVPPVGRAEGALRFVYQPPRLSRQIDVALVGRSDYRVVMPATVDIKFDIAGKPGVQSHLWMTASPLDSGSCRTFWFVARNDGHDQADEEFLAFQDRVLREDEVVVCNQAPEFPLSWGDELSVRADRVSIEYRRWLIDLVLAAREDPERLRSAVAGPSGRCQGVPIGTPTSRSPCS